MYRFDTLAIHAGHRDDDTGAVCTPIYQTTTYRQHEPGSPVGGFVYSRTEHPTRRALEENLAALEGARYGLAFSTGMAAIHNVISILRAGDHIVSSQDLYGGAWRIFTKFFAKFGVDFTFVDACDLAAIERAIRPETKMLWLETPSNPLVRVSDIAGCAAIARRHKLLTVVDNTFATPVLQQPLTLGADVVVHSTTKYMNGHSDALGGAVITDDEALWTELKFFQNAVGSVPGPQDCFLTLRGVQTLGLRVERHCTNAEQVAEMLRAHPRVKRVYYPDRDTVARRQMSRFGGMVSFELDGGLETAKAFSKELKLWTLAESLGSVVSLFCHPATMTHASVEPDVRRKVGIADGLIRLSVGLEDVRDLVEDLEQALEVAREEVA
jgi:cystathionine gamma-lyase